MRVSIGHVVRHSDIRLLIVLVAGALALPAFDSAEASANGLTTLYSLCSQDQCRDGTEPQGLLLDKSGNIFGAARNGGSDNHGTVFELQDETTYRHVHTYCKGGACRDGAFPNESLIIDTSGNLYGTTINGGRHDAGTVYRLMPAGGSWTYQKLHDFCTQGNNCRDGAYPAGGLTYAGAASGAPYDGRAPLYGLTTGGFIDGKPYGSVAYQLQPDTDPNDEWTATILRTFCSEGGKSCADGAVPTGSLLADDQGNLFGAASLGGANHPNGYENGGGLIFQMSPSGDRWKETVLYNFCSQHKCQDGAAPWGSLIFDASGNLLGVANSGGAHCDPGNLAHTACGVVFELARNGSNWEETGLHAFCVKKDCRDGVSPRAPLVIDSAGNLFGVTTYGGGNDMDVLHNGGGVAYQLNGSNFDVLHAFCTLPDCEDGSYPGVGMIRNAKGRLIGTTLLGGPGIGAGTVFELKP